MSQLVLDDQLDLQRIVPALEGWITSVRLQNLRPAEQILDERVPELLLTLNRPTFVTIDRGFWNRKLSHAGYCILVFALATDEQQMLPGLLRRVLRLPQFETRAARMGKIARVQKRALTFWEGAERKILKLPEND